MWVKCYNQRICLIKPLKIEFYHKITQFLSWKRKQKEMVDGAYPEPLLNKDWFIGQDARTL